jgi:hypothetical protein
LKSTALREWFFTFELLTAFFFSCFGPTLFLGSRVAAKAAPPPTNKKTAIVDMTFA